MLDEMLPSNLLAEFVACLYRHQKTDAASPLVSSGKVFCVRHGVSLLLFCFPRRGQKQALSGG